MLVVSIPAMVKDYVRCPETAIEDYRILVNGVWSCLRTGNAEFPEVRSLASIIDGKTASGDTNSDATVKVDFTRELDFRSLNLLSPVDSIRRFIETIEFCRDSSEATLFSRIELSDLRGLFELLANRGGDNEFAIRETLHRVERNLDNFAKTVEIRRVMGSDHFPQNSVLRFPTDTFPSESCSTGNKLKSRSDEEKSPQATVKKRPDEKVKGAQTEKLVSYLTRHHDYLNGIVGNYEPAGSATIKIELKMPASTVSDFLQREFPSPNRPRAGYVLACRNQDALLLWFLTKHGDRLPVRTANLEAYDVDKVRERR